MGRTRGLLAAKRTDAGGRGQQGQHRRNRKDEPGGDFAARRSGQNRRQTVQKQGGGRVEALCRQRSPALVSRDESNQPGIVPPTGIFPGQVEERAHEGIKQALDGKVCPVAQSCQRIKACTRQRLGTARDGLVKEGLLAAAVMVDGSDRLARFCDALAFERDVYERLVDRQAAKFEPPAGEDIDRHKRQMLPGDYRRKLAPATIDRINTRLERQLAYFGYL